MGRSVQICLTLEVRLPQELLRLADEFLDLGGQQSIRSTLGTPQRLCAPSFAGGAKIPPPGQQSTAHPDSAACIQVELYYIRRSCRQR